MYAINLKGASERWRPRPFAALARALLAQRGHLLLWVPVFLGCGIGLYFALPFEPSPLHYAAVLALAALAMAGAWWAAEPWRPVWGALMIACMGLCLAGARSHAVGAPVLSFRYYGPIEGRVVGIDRSVSDKIRVTLDEVWLEDVAPERTPPRVRVALHGDAMADVPMPGARVMTSGHLSPPGGAIEPGGFDFQRHAWFRGLGAVGYTRVPLVLWEPSGQGLAVFKTRMALSRAVQDRMSGVEGALAAAIVTGDRSGIDRPTLEALRISNLAHLLAISGLHMGLATGLVFSLIRLLVACVPYLALRVSGKKIAAAVALAAGAGYLLLSGGAVSTERAFVMVAVMLGAVLLGQRALSLRAVAVAAIVVLILSPEALFSPGFQMSFAATTALVGVFGVLRDVQGGKRWPRWVQGIGALLLSSAVAGAATAPFAAAHFNRFTDYGLFANLASVPLMGSVVMPGAIAAGLGAPLGLEGPGLWVMEQGLAWILGVATFVAGLPGAVTHLPAPPWFAVPLIALGGLWVLLWQGGARWAGGVALVGALATWALADRPDVLIEPQGNLVGVMTKAGRVPSKPKGAGFAARSWLENDGDGATQAAAAERPGWRGKRGDRTYDWGQVTLRHVTGKRAPDRLPERCERGEIWITDQVLRRKPSGPCLVIDAKSLRQSGALALRQTEEGMQIQAATKPTLRLWQRR